MRQKNQPIRLIFLGMTFLAVIMSLLAYGTDFRVLDPQGFIADEQFKLLLFSAGLLCAIGIPTVFIFYYFAWQYRESNTKIHRDPQASGGKHFALYAWGIPTAFALILALVMWPATHRLEPKDPIVANAKPMTIQVVALRWKWLFIYPEQNIATVNYVKIPVGTPIQFELTADDTPMSSFWVPKLGGQLYAMTGHVNTLNLIAANAGDYAGSTAEINGEGFAGMKFTVQATDSADFDQWVSGMQRSLTFLNKDTYSSLLNPSEDEPQANYALASPDLYDAILSKYMAGHQHSNNAETTETSDTSHHSHMEHHQ